MKTDTTMVGIRPCTVAYALKYLREYEELLEDFRARRVRLYDKPIVVSQRMKRTMKELEEIQ